MKRVLATPAVAVLLLALFTASAIASGEPQESFLYNNFLKASQVLDRAVAAHGGAALLDANVRVSFAGNLRYEAHYPQPWAHRDYSVNGTMAYAADERALESVVTIQDRLDQEVMPSFKVVGPSNGIWLDAGDSRPDTIATADLAKSIREDMEMLPQEYLRQARDHAASLRLLIGSDDYDVVSYALDADDTRALFFDKKTHLLARVERIGHWKLKGDRLEWRTFTGYEDKNGVRVPIKSENHVENYSTQQNLATQITQIEFGATVDANTFMIPEPHRAGFETWALRHPSPVEALLPSHDLGKGLYVIDLPPSTARSLLVAFDTFSVIVEAGDHSEISAQVLATADHLLPGKPVRYVAMSHHHPLYANGLRPYVKRGITILTTKGNVDYYRELTTRPYRIHPDAQQLDPHEPKIEVIEGKRILKEGKQRLELYPFDYSTHVDEFVLAYAPAGKLIVTGDLVYILRNKELRPASPRELAIYRFVKERGLKVENIMQTWFLQESDSTVPYSILEEKVRMAQAKASK